MPLSESWAALEYCWSIAGVAGASLGTAGHFQGLSSDLDYEYTLLNYTRAPTWELQLRIIFW